MAALDARLAPPWRSAPRGKSHVCCAPPPAGTCFASRLRTLSLEEPVLRSAGLRWNSSACAATGSRGQQAAAEWSDLAAAADDDYVPEEDPVFQADINRLCNVGVKAMLNDDRRAVSEWQGDLNLYGSHFGEEGNRDAAIFVYTLYQMSEHKLPTESLQLKGLYLTAFGKVFNLLEDSGWALKSGEEDDEESTAGRPAGDDDQGLLEGL